MTGRRGRRCKQLLNDVTEPTGYWKLKEDALDRILWKTRFGRGTYVCTLVRSTFVELWTLTIQQFTAVHNTLSTRNTEFQNKKNVSNYVTTISLRLVCNIEIFVEPEWIAKICCEAISWEDPGNEARWYFVYMVTEEDKQRRHTNF